MKIFCSILLVLSCLTSFSQSKNKQSPIGEIFGNVQDSIDNSSLSYITIRVFTEKDKKLVGGSVSSENGTFSISNLPFGSYFIDVSFAGYQTKLFENINLSKNESTHQLKNILMAPLMLDEVEISSSRPLINYEIDKKIINVEDQINTDGQSAIEILENIPSITISAEGTVSLRGSSSFTLLIDGIPTIMDASDYLASIPASTVKEIEVITNPSAKYDAEGTSGVLNIVTKKNKLEGLSLLINGQLGLYKNNSSNISLSSKRKKSSFDLNASFRMRSNPNEQINNRITTYDTVINRLYSSGDKNWRRTNFGINGSYSWKPNNSHILLLSGKLKSNLMNPYNNLQYTNYSNAVVTDEFRTTAHNYIQFMNNSFSLNYQYNFKRNKEHNLSFKAIANFSGANQQDTTLTYDTEGRIISGNLYTETGPSNSNRYKVDYTRPMKNMKLQSGIQSQFGNSGDVGKNYTLDTITDTFIFDSIYSSDVDYVRDIHAAYVMLGGKQKQFGYQIGLRAEYTFRSISSSNSIKFNDINRLDWFPSGHFSYNLKKGGQLMASYSQRIQRPRSYYFEPFITWTGPFNVRSGNPNLQPTYIDVFELNYLHPLSKNNFFSIEGYARKNKGIIQRLSTVYAQDILITRPENIGNSAAYGLEASIDYQMFKWWKINTGGNAFLYQLSGQLAEELYSAESINYNVRLTSTFTVLENWFVQFISRYQSGSVTAQGLEYSNFTQDVSIKTNLASKKISITLQGRNVLNTARRQSISTIENVFLYSRSIPYYPQLFLSLSVKLNNYQKKYEDQEEMDDF